MALLIAIVMILAGSIGAHFVNTSGGTVKVSRIAFDTDQGKLSGLLYLPKGASQSSPRPAVVLTHGYLNSAEMQDANAIELSRRGYVVLDIDMYDHGHSRINRDKYSGTDFFSLWSAFWTNSIYDAVQYIYEQPYVLKDADGNGIIGVTGHSMGGFSTTVALAKDEADYAANGFRKISCGLSEGSDFSYSGIVGVTAEAADKAGGGRIMGKVAARYDEFFFNDPETTGGTVRRKDYVATPDAKTFLEQESPAADTWYDTSDGGKRIIYEPSQTHPWNHFSKTTTADAIDFYQTAFSGYTDGISNIPSSSQTWMWKEALECLALIGFVLLIVPAAGSRNRCEIRGICFSGIYDSASGAVFHIPLGCGSYRNRHEYSLLCRYNFLRQRYLCGHIIVQRNRVSEEFPDRRNLRRSFRCLTFTGNKDADVSGSDKMGSTGRK